MTIVGIGGLTGLQSFLAKYNTFRIFGERPQGLLHDAVLRGLTRNLGMHCLSIPKRKMNILNCAAKQINPVSMKMAICLESTWGESKGALVLSKYGSTISY